MSEAATNARVANRNGRYIKTVLGLDGGVTEIAWPTYRPSTAGMAARFQKETFLLGAGLGEVASEFPEYLYPSVKGRLGFSECRIPRGWMESGFSEGGFPCVRSPSEFSEGHFPNGGRHSEF